MAREKRKARKDSRIKEDFRSKLTDATHLDGMSKEEMDKGKGKAKKDKKAYEETFLGRTMAKMNMNKHRKMERTLRSFVMASSVLLVGGGYALYSAHQQNVAEAHKETPIDGIVSFSKTQSSFTVGQVYRSTDSRTAYIPLTFDKMDELSTDANDYTILLYNENEKYTYKADMKLVMFGATGNAVIVVNGAPEIGSEPLRVFLRNDKSMAGVLEGTDDTMVGDSVDMMAASKAFDIAMFMVNPGADNVKVNKALSGKKLDAMTIYQEAVSKPAVKLVQDSIKESRKTIKDTVKLVDEYEARLKREGYEVPERPVYMKEDWMPANRAPVDVDSTITKGFIVESAVVGKPAIDDEDAQNADLVVDEPQDEEHEFAEYLTRDDGTTTMDTEGADGVNSAQNEWAKLIELYESVQQEKMSIYVDYGQSLYSIQRELERQNRTATIGLDERFRLIGKVKLGNGAVIPKDGLRQDIEATPEGYVPTEPPKETTKPEEESAETSEKETGKPSKQVSNEASDSMNKTKEKEDRAPKSSESTPDKPVKESKKEDAKTPTNGSIEPTNRSPIVNSDDAS